MKIVKSCLTAVLAGCCSYAVTAQPENIIANWDRAFYSAPSSDTLHNQKTESIVRLHKTRFSLPPKRIPITTATDAPVMGNGQLGIAIGGPPELQTFYFSRNDFWRFKSSYDESYPLTAGRLTVAIESIKGASYFIEQDMFTASTHASFVKDGTELKMKSYVAATQDLLIVELSTTSDTPVSGTFSLDPPAQQQIKNNPFLTVISTDSFPHNISFISRTFTHNVDLPSTTGIALRPYGESKQGKFTLTNTKPLLLVCSSASQLSPSDNCKHKCVEMLNGLDEPNLQQVEQTHRDWWREFWNKSHISITDKEIERFYYISLYGMASCSRARSFPPGLFGNWITAEPPAWNGDYHLNYNFCAPFYALYSANRLEQAMPYYDPLLAFMPRGKHYSEKVCRIDSGILYPVGIGPLGIETVRANAKLRRQYSRDIEDEGLFFGQKSNAAYCALNFSTHFYLTYDQKFTASVYPYIKAVSNFWESYLVFENGRYVIYNDAIHEGSIGSQNPILTLGLVRNLMRTVIDMSTLLNTDRDRHAKWNHILTHLSPYPTQIENDIEFFRYTEKGMSWNNGNTLGIQHIYPAGEIGLESDSRLLLISHNTINKMQRWHDYNGSNSFFPAAVRVGYPADVILKKLNEYCRHTAPNGFQLNNPHGIENWSTVPNTVNEMLCNAHQGILRVFKQWDGTNASFAKIRVEGAFLVSGELKDGIIGPVTIVSERGRPCTIENPWKGKRILLHSDRSKSQILFGDRITFKTSPGETIILTPESSQKQ